ncbi:MAG TPA: HigA family addiction module antitoxin [Methylovirgula sp.]
MFSPIHPGEQLREEFMKRRGISCERLAEEIGVETDMVTLIVTEREAVSSEMALRLSRYFGTTARFWLDLQRDYDLDRTTHALGDRLDFEVKPTLDGINFGVIERRARPRLG